MRSCILLQAHTYFTFIVGAMMSSRFCVEWNAARVTITSYSSFVFDMIALQAKFELSKTCSDIDKNEKSRNSGVRNAGGWGDMCLAEKAPKYQGLILVRIDQV